LDGFLGLYVEPDDLIHFEIGATVLVGGIPHVVRALRPADRGFQVAFEGVDRAAADEIRGRDVTVDTRRSLAEGEYWPETLVGLEVRGQGGERLGAVVAVVAGVAQDRLVVESAGSRFEVPFVDDLVPVVDVDSGYVEIVDLPGLTEQ
jgi:16S rRNA processing protein RimM